MAKPDYSRLGLPPPPRDRPYVLLNMVMSADGKVVVEGSERGIGSTVDQRLMRELRVNADVVLVGAGTLRASGASSRLGGFTELEEIRLRAGKPRFPICATLTATGDLPLDRTFFTADDFRAVVYLSESATPARREALEATGRDVVLVPEGEAVPAMLRHMRDYLGARVLLLEGGPTVNADFFARDLVDEFFLTVGPVVIAGRDSLTAVEGTPFTRESMKRLELLWAEPNEETDEVYLRYRVKHPPKRAGARP